MGIKTALLWLSLFVIVFVTWRVLNLPEGAEMQTLVQSWLSTYGLPLVLFGSIVEALFFLGLYFPGSILIFLAVGLAPTPTYAVKVVLLASLGMIVGYTINYFVGKHGWYRVLLRLGMRDGLEQAKRNMERNDVRYVAYTFWNAGFAAFTATAAGILHIPLRRFFTLIIPAVLIWNSLWGAVVYQLGEQALLMIDGRVVLAILIAWISIEGLVLWYRRQHSN